MNSICKTDHIRRNIESDSMNGWWETNCLLPFSAPTTILICGRTQSGKTTLQKTIAK